MVPTLRLPRTMVGYRDHKKEVQISSIRILLSRCQGRSVCYITSHVPFMPAASIAWPMHPLQPFASGVADKQCVPSAVRSACLRDE